MACILITVNCSIHHSHAWTSTPQNVTPKDQPQLWEFVHPCVQQAHPELLVHIKRKENSQKSRQRTLVRGRRFELSCLLFCAVLLFHTSCNCPFSLA